MPIQTTDKFNENSLALKKLITKLTKVGQYRQDVAYVDKLAKCNNGVKYLLVAVDVLLRYLRVVPMRSKSDPDAAKAFEKMIEKVQPQKVWSDKGIEFKGAFKNLCDQRGVATYTNCPKQSYKETRATFTISSCRAVKQICQKTKVQSP